MSFFTRWVVKETVKVRLFWKNRNWERDIKFLLALRDDFSIVKAWDIPEFG
jgi:hypothetical protein